MHHLTRSLILLSRRPLRWALALCLLSGACSFLAACEEKEAPVDAARDLFDTTNPDKRRAAIGQLTMEKWGHGEAYMKAYRTLSTDPDPMVRGQAMIALSDGPDPNDASIAEILLRGLGDKEVFVRRCAAEGLGRVTNDSAALPLAERMKTDEDPAVRVLCAKALKAYNRPRVVRSLIDALDDRDVAVGEYAWRSLKDLTGQDLSHESRPWLEWWQAKENANTQPKKG